LKDRGHPRAIAQFGVCAHERSIAWLWSTAQLSGFNKFTQAEAQMFRKFTHLMFS